MNRCIQFKVGDEAFKFENVDLTDIPYNMRSILGAIARDTRHLSKVNDLINTINAKSSDLSANTAIKDASEYADTVLGDISPLGLSAILRDAGISSSKVDSLILLLGKNSENIIKINESLDSPVVYLGNNRTLIGAPTKSLSSESIIQALSYVYLDSKVKNTASNVSKILDKLFYEFKDETLKYKGKISTTVLKELDSLDSVNRNKRLLSYLFNESLRAENIDLFRDYSKILQSIVDDAIESSNKLYKPITDAALYSIIPLGNNKEISLSENVNTSLGKVAELLKGLRTNLKVTIEEALEIIGIESENPSKEELINIVVENFTKINPNGVYDDSVFTSYFPAQLLQIYNNADMLYEIFDVTEKAPEKLETILQNIIIDNRPVTKGELPLSKVNVEFGNNLFVTPSRRIMFDSLGKNPAGFDNVLNIKLNTRIHGDKGYKLDKNTLIINPNKFNYNTPLELDNISKDINAVYIPLSSEPTQIYIDVLRALAKGKYVREFKTDGLEEQSIRLAIEANNLGLSITVHPKDGKFRSRVDGPINLDELAERFSFIQPLIPGSLKPKMNFYNENSSNGYEFTNRKGNNNLNRTLTTMEESLPNDKYLDYFDLTSKGVITSLIVSQKTKDNNILIDSAIGSRIEIHDTKSERFNKFNVINKYKLNGAIELSNEDDTPELGKVYKLNNKKLVVCSQLDNGDVIGLGYISETEPKQIKVSKDNFQKYTFSNQQYPARILANGEKVVNFRNNYFLYKNGRAKKVNASDLFDFYSNELNKLSETSGFSLEFIKNKKFSTKGSDGNIHPDKDSFNYMVVIEISPAEEKLVTNNNSESLKNFSGKLFIERLANKLNTPVHFLTATQMTAISKNFAQAKGVIYNGEIYINLDKFSDDKGVVLHELSHVLLAYFKENNYDGYVSLLNSLAMEGPEFDELKSRYPELTNQDLREEYLAEKFSKSFNTLFTDENLDKQLASMDFINAMNKFLSLSTDISKDVRTLMSATISEIAQNSRENIKLFGDIFPKVTHNWGVISNLKSQLLQSTDPKNKLTESNCR